MEALNRIDIKVFASEANVDTAEFMGVFQRWIQQHVLPGTLVDVVDYHHMHNGPGVVLVAHEYNVSMDFVGGEPGLLVHYKRFGETADSLQSRIETALHLGYTACRQLEQEPEFTGRLTFDAGRILVMPSDRLHAPNRDETYEALEPVAKDAIAAVLGLDVTVERVEDDARNRPALRARAAHPVAIGSVPAPAGA